MQQIIESFVIVHEDSLLALKVLSQSVHGKIRSIRTNPQNSVFPQWLGVESIQTLKEILRAFKKNMPKTQKPPVAAELVSNDEELINEEVWDKEDIDEIQGKIANVK